MLSTQSSGSARGAISAAFTVVTVLFLSASLLNAQTRSLQEGFGTIPRAFFGTPSSEAQLTPLGNWKPAIEPVSTNRNVRHWQQPPFPGRTSTKRTSGQRKTLGAVLGVAGGFIVGGLVGGVLDRNCGCDDPGLEGVFIGAPIGAIAGGVLGFILASR